MSGEFTEEAGRWRQQAQAEAASGNTRTRKWSTAALLAATMFAIAALAIFLITSIFIRTGPKAYLAPIWTARFQRAQLATIPWIDADRKAIEDGDYFSEVAPGGFDDRTLEEVKSRLADLSSRPKTDSVVIYVATYGLVDRDGAIRICASDSDPSDPETMLALRDLLQGIKACPASQKLLVLDIMKANPSAVDPGGLATADGVADLLKDELAAVPDGNLRVIASASPGQTALGTEVLGRSIFNKLFCQGLDESIADSDANGWVNASELTSFLQTGVDRWAQHNLAQHQQPFTTGDGPDFPLIALNRTKVKAAVKAVAAILPSAKNDPADPSKKAPEASKEAVVVDANPYPTWLAEAWQTREAWWADNSIVIAPRALRMFDAILLRSEHDWRAGVDLPRLKSEFDRGLSTVQTERSRALDVPRPPIRSVGQARAFAWKAQGTAAKDLADLLNTRRKQPTPDALKAAVKIYIDSLKGKTSLDLANAISESAADSRWTPDLAKFLDDLVDQARAADPSLKRDLVELRFLQRLAKRASSVKDVQDWSETAAKSAWQAITMAEELDSRSDSLPWIGKDLDRADALRIEAEVLLLPETAGIAAWKRIEDAWSAARDAYQKVAAQERSLGAARVSLASARLVLPAYVAYLDATDQGDLEGAWLEAADATQRLDALTNPPSEGSEPSFDKIGQATGDLDRLLGELLSPFQTSAITAVGGHSNDATADPKLVSVIDAILSTPFPLSKDRIDLWKALRAIEERQAAQPSEELVEISDGAPDSSRITIARDSAKRKSHILTGLLKLAGVDGEASKAAFAAIQAIETTGQPATPPPSDDPKDKGKESAPRSDLAMVWEGIANAEIDVRSALSTLAKSRTADSDRSVVFAPVYGSEVFTSPSLSRRETEARAAWTRLASRYLHERTDLNDPDQFYEGAALECIRVGGAPATGDLQVAVGPDVVAANLSASHPEATLTARLTWHAGASDAGSTRPFQLALITPDDPRLAIKLGTDPKAELKPETPVDIPIKATWNDEPDSGSRKFGRPPVGFLLKVTRADTRSEYLLLPLAITAESDRLRLVLSDSATEVNPLPFDLKLRTLPGRQKLYLHVKNPTDAPRNLIAHLISSTGSDAASEVVLNEAKVTALASRTTPVVAFAAPPIKPADPLGGVPPGLKIRLVDADTNKVVDEAAIKPTIAPPLSYIRVMKSQFEPTRPGEPNRLSVSLRALPDLTGPACPVALDVSRDPELFPSLLSPPKGRLVGEIEPAGEVIIYADQLALDPSVSREGTFAIDIDGQKRALWFKTKFPIQGGPQQAQINAEPRIRFNASPNVKADQPARLDVDFLVDNAPPKATVEFRLGRVEGGSIVDDITPWVNTAKQGKIGFDARGEAGAILFEATLTDWSPSLLTAGIRGERRLQARLIDADGRTVLDTAEKTMILDDLKPQEVSLGPIPSQVPKGTATIPVTAVSLVPASSVKEMIFFLGKSADYEKALAAGATAKGKPSPADPSTWAADLPIPTAAVNPLIISVRVASGVDLIAFASEESELVAAGPTPAEDKAKKEADANKPGTVTGKVSQGTLAQPNLAVSLVEIPAKPGTDPVKAEAKTDKTGAFTFKDVKPGKYQLSTRNNASLTKSTKEITVEPAKTVSKDLDLLR